MNLIKGEKLDLTGYETETLVNATKDQINEKYIKGEVRIITEQARYPLTAIVGMVESEDYALNPEFQRRHRWNNIQKSKLIESFIMNVPIPPIFLYEDKFSHYEVMDGLQRMTAIYEFYKDKFELEGLDEWKELNGKRYSELPVQVKKGVDRRYLSSIILLQETAKTELEANRLKQLVFERINSGGVKLEPQETRNAIFNGDLNQLCLKLSRNTNLCKLWDIPLPDSEEVEYGIFSDELRSTPAFAKMEDVELVLRFFANRQRAELFKGTRFRDYLDFYLKHGNEYSTETLQSLESLFLDTLSFIYELFGEKAFWLYRRRNGSWNWYSRPTTAVFDILTQVASEYLPHKEKILEQALTIDSQMEEFYKNNYDSFEGRNTNASVIVVREQLFNDLFKSWL
ncbi:DUF262 domain-containing protein [Sunxiuqinia elliptica]|uniref:GmrSD restriction endonucleases N-terminal domain-containing protein n=1 Tax=Sunxiuqinia elliptica TaxID=655355 RepID=A0A1I2HL80_9BACT|nr:DUF262 domain-containing protein [Sunxiuqinia elliptica]SFF30519.1 Protein of unknown function DUF262 [Sunxiuqinia elliptica]